MNLLSLLAPYYFAFTFEHCKIKLNFNIYMSVKYYSAEMAKPTRHITFPLISYSSCKSLSF
jgi:hypothetical protein